MYANLQSADGLAANHYTLEDTGRWRELTVHPHDLPGAPGTRFDLRVSAPNYQLLLWLFVHYSVLPGASVYLSASLCSLTASAPASAGSHVLLWVCNTIKHTRML